MRSRCDETCLIDTEALLSLNDMLNALQYYFE